MCDFRKFTFFSCVEKNLVEHNITNFMINQTASDLAIDDIKQSFR